MVTGEKDACMRLFRFWLQRAGYALLAACCLLAPAAAPAAEPAGRFIVLADLHIGQNDARLQTRYDEMVREIRRADPAPIAVFAIGDITEQGDEAEFDRFLATFVTPLKAAGIPLYAVPGSRDNGRQGLEPWKRAIGPLYQAVTLGDIRFILACSVPEDAPGQPAARGGVIGTNQLAWIRTELEAPETRAATWVVLVTHFPLWPEDFGGPAIQDLDAAGQPTEAARSLQAWAAEPGIDLVLCASRHLQAAPIVHPHPNGRQTWHLLNESAVMGRVSRVSDGRGGFRTLGGFGYQVFDVDGGRLTHTRKPLDAAGYARLGPQNVCPLDRRPAAEPAPNPEPPPPAD